MSTANEATLQRFVRLPGVVLDERVRQLCPKSYPLHPKGCPNYGKRTTCPPQARLWQAIYDLAAPVYAVVHEFDLGGHVARIVRIAISEMSATERPTKMACIIVGKEE
jgi:hypothetical protein